MKTKDRESIIARLFKRKAISDNPESSEASRENDFTGKKGVSGRSLPRRMLLKSLKILFVWIPIVLVVLILTALLAAWLYLTPGRVERLIVENFKEMSNGDISLKVDSFSPYSGFVMRDIVIRNGEEFGRSEFVKIERLVLKYGLFPILIGNIRFEEIGIYKPRIYLEEKNGIWNAARLMKPSEKKPEKKKEEKKKEEEEGPPSKEINLPVSVEFLFKFVLDDLRVYAKGSQLKSALEGLSFGVDIWIPPFKTIPKSVEAVKLLERMKIELNPKEEMDVTFYSRDADVSPPLILTWKLLFSKSEKGKPQFESRLKMGTYKTPVRFKRSHLAPLSFMVSYDVFYNPINDYLKLNHLGVKFRSRKWLYMTGEVKNVATKQDISLKMTESDIALSDLYPYFVQVTGNRRMKFGGNISLYPLTIQGNIRDIDINGELNMRKIHFRNPGIEASIPSFKLGYQVFKRGDNMKILSKLNLPHLYYAMERNKSGDNGLNLSLDVSAFENFRKVDINSMSLRFYNPAGGGNALDLGVRGQVYLKPELNGNVKITRFLFRKQPLIGMLPKSFRKKLANIPLKKPVSMSLDTGFALGKKVIKADLGVLIKVPDFDVNDAAIKVSIVQDNAKKRLTINKLYLGSRQKNLSVTADGFLDMKKPPFSNSDLRLSVLLDIPKMKTIYSDWKMAGKIELKTRVTGDLKDGKASGTFRIDRFFVRNDKDKTSVEDLNMKFPFEYYFTPRYKGESRILLDKSSIIDNAFFKEKENFTIKSIKAKHPARDISFEYLKDFSATMFFRDNTFEIVKLKAYVLDGALYGRDILFNLADMKKQNFEYKLILDVTNVDIGRLDDPDVSKKTRDAELSLNANFVGKNLDFSKELNIKGYINIYKIGDKFANRLMTGLSTEKGKSKLGMAQFAVDNSQTVRSFNFNLDKGLVYATVLFVKKGVFGYLVGVKDEKVEFERMPIQEYLRKVREVQ